MAPPAAAFPRMGTPSEIATPWYLLVWAATPLTIPMQEASSGFSKQIELIRFVDQTQWDLNRGVVNRTAVDASFDFSFKDDYLGGQKERQPHARNLLSASRALASALIGMVAAR
jgi:hypothetical protein